MAINKSACLVAKIFQNVALKVKITELLVVKMLSTTEAKFSFVKW